MNTLSTEYRDMSVQLREFERRVQARDPQRYAARDNTQDKERET